MEPTDEFDYFGRLDDATLKTQAKADKDAAGIGKFVSMQDANFKRFRFYHLALNNGLPFHPCKQHWVTDPGTGKKRTVVCRQLAKEPCPLCDYVQELLATGDPNDKKLADEMNANFDYLANVEDQDEPETIKILRVKPTLYKSLIGTDEKTRAASLRSKSGDFMDPVTGYLVEVTKYDTAPWYTSAVARDQDDQKIKAPAKRHLGPKLHDLSKETIVPALSVVADTVYKLRNGLALADRPGFGGQPALGNRAPARGALPGPQPGNKRGPSVQSTVDVKVDDSLFGD